MGGGGYILAGGGRSWMVVDRGGWSWIYFAWWWVVIDGSGSWWVVVDIFWLVVGGGESWWVVA